MRKLTDSIFTFRHLNLLKQRLIALKNQKNIITRENFLEIWNAAAFSEMIFLEPLSKRIFFQAFDVEDEIDYREFLLSLCPYLEAPFLETSEFYYRLFDTNNDSLMDKSEFIFFVKCYCKNLGIEFSIEKVDEIWKVKAEKINLQEFRTIWEKKPFFGKK